MSIHNPAKLLYDNLSNIHIADANINSLDRLTDHRKQFWILSNSKDLFTDGVADYSFILNKEAAFAGLATKIKNFELAIKFNLMIIPPKTVISSSLNIVDNVVVRIIDYYEIRLDEVLTRYDILIEKVNSNV